MTGAGVALDAKQGRGMPAREAGRERIHVDTTENLLNVTAAILGRERAVTKLETRRMEAPSKRDTAPAARAALGPRSPTRPRVTQHRSLRGRVSAARR